jgi:hypothetical protein
MQTAQQAHARRAAVNLCAAPLDIHATHADDPDAALGARLNFYAAALAEAERRARIFRTPREEMEALLMRRPVTTEQAFARFGLLLGTLPPVAIFYRIFGGWIAQGALGMLVLVLLMLFVCAFLGRFMAKRLGGEIVERERRSWPSMLLGVLGYAFVWAAVTGTAGGAIYFGIGCIFGFACALPCALVAFSVFVPLHRLLARGGMIDARQLNPLAWGINMAIATLILSPKVIPY